MDFSRGPPVVGIAQARQLRHSELAAWQALGTSGAEAEIQPPALQALGTSRAVLLLVVSSALCILALAAGAFAWLSGWLPDAPWAEPSIRSASFTVLGEYPHEANCFTQGLFFNGSEHDMFESCGRYRISYIRRFAIDTGETLQSGEVPAEFFAEGLALLGEALYLLTWQHNLVIEYNAATMAEVRRHAFPHEGWGLTTDGCDLLATTGSENIYRLRPDTSGDLQVIGAVRVTNEGWPVRSLNELEYVTPKIWVHQWRTNWIFRVDPVSGAIELKLDVGSLYAWRGEATPNGVAYSASFGQDTLLVTGKLWPRMFALQLSAVDLCGGAIVESAQLDGQQVCPRTPLSACRQSR